MSDGLVSTYWGEIICTFGQGEIICTFGQGYR